MKIKKAGFFIVLLLVFFPIFPDLKSQNRPVNFTRLDVNNGLSHNQVNCILKDSKGFMWFGTMSGLNRYDGYTFKIFRNNHEDSSSINDNYIINICEDHQGKIWVNTRNGYCIYDPETESFSSNIRLYLSNLRIPEINVWDVYKDRHGLLWLIQSNRGIFRYTPADHSVKAFFHDPADEGSLVSDDISSFIQDHNGDYWLITHNGILQQLSGKSLKVVFKDFSLNRIKGEQWLEYKIFVDNENDLWIYASNYSSGAFLFNTKNKTLNLISKESDKIRLNNNTIKGIVQDDKGYIWIGTDHGGINIIDKKRNAVDYLVSNPYDKRSLSQNSITSLYKDDQGIIWAGTFKKGINYFHEEIIRFGLIKHSSQNPANISYDDVNTICEDKNGNLWIGTNGNGLVYFNRIANKFTYFRHDPSKPNSISNDVIVCLYLDNNGILWIGTFYGGLNSFNGKSFRRYIHNSDDVSSLSDDRVWIVTEDSQQHLWVGTLGGGLNILDRNTGKFRHFKSGEANSVASDFIFSITEDLNHNLWIGTAQGISILDRQSGIFRHVSREAGLPSGLSNNNVISIIRDNRGWMWVGTREGLNVYMPYNGSFIKISRSQGLPDNTILSLLEDNSGNIWLATSHGLSNIIIDKHSTNDSLIFSIKNYDEPDGIQGKEFNERAAFKTHAGELLFGGADGINIFNPGDIKINKHIPSVYFTNLEIFNTPIRVNEKVHGRIILKKSITETREITLKYHENMFSVEFAALDYFQPIKNRFKYKLEGFNANWIETDAGIRKASYTNLNPGAYILRVIASNNDGYWNETGASLKIKVMPPFWKTKFAIVLYFIMVLLLLLLLRYIVLERERMNFRLQQEKLEADRRHEIDMLKIKFITNVSHEFKTPLSLIITPVEKMLKSIDKADLRNQLLMIHRNAKRLLNLVNQLLDFRRLEIQQIKLLPSAGDIVSFSRDITYSFSDLAEKKNITLRFFSDIESLIVLFDHDKLEKIIFNLLSNAFKFTHEHGQITVTLSHKYEEIPATAKPESMFSWIVLKVADTGIGIPKEKKDKVFEGFFQLDNQGIISQGTGIGLSLVNEYVKLHKGRIELESETGKGSCFTILLPVTTDMNNGGDNLIQTAKIEETVYSDSISNEKIYDHNPTILLVEDNEDFLLYLKDNLKNNYNIFEAPDGHIGLKIAREKSPDLIVSDIMMPEMDGIELLRNLKNDKHTSHIPVILLTARNSDHKKLEGFDVGADDYITKPFSFEILESRIKNLIHQRKLIRKSFQKIFELTPSEIKVTSLDEKLIQKAIAIVEKNIANANFSVDQLAREIGMSRVHLYKKLTALTGKTPLEFIRVIRLRRASRLLEKSQLTISEIAYQVGFNNPKYFAKYFKEEYKMLPSDYVASKGANAVKRIETKENS
jgi:signal transduction histidine kinase/ligand-binding sensor domain-containing protein/DNA-binding response OmpR family regulator